MPGLGGISTLPFPFSRKAFSSRSIISFIDKLTASISARDKQRSFCSAITTPCDFKNDIALLGLIQYEMSQRVMTLLTIVRENFQTGSVWEQAIKRIIVSNPPPK